MGTLLYLFNIALKRRNHAKESEEGVPAAPERNVEQLHIPIKFSNFSQTRVFYFEIWLTPLTIALVVLNACTRLFKIIGYMIVYDNYVIFMYNILITASGHKTI